MKMRNTVLSAKYFYFPVSIMMEAGHMERV